MRFYKVAVLMVGSTILLTGCAQRQYHRGHQRTYHRSTQYHTPTQSSPPGGIEYHADPPITLPKEHPREPSGPIQPVPAPPATEVSLGKVRGVSHTTVSSSYARNNGCVSEPRCTAADLEGCDNTTQPVQRKSYFSKSADFFKRLCRKKPTKCVDETSCGTVDPPSEGCTARKSYLPKIKCGLLTGIYEKCVGKKHYPLEDLCVPACEGCCTDQGVGTTNRSFHTQPGDTTSRPTSPKVAPMEDPFEQPATRPEVPAIPVTPRPVPESRQQARPTPPTAPTGTALPGRPQPVEDVPPLPLAPKDLNPMPQSEQSYFEPPTWPRLRVPSARVANVPASQTSWGTNPPVNTPTWRTQTYGTSIPPQPIQSNISPWSTWQAR